MMTPPTLPGTEPAALTADQLRALYHTLVRARWPIRIVRRPAVARHWTERRKAA